MVRHRPADDNKAAISEVVLGTSFRTTGRRMCEADDDVIINKCELPVATPIANGKAK